MMSVFKRKTTSGSTAEFHYRYMKKGKLYYGVCEGCVDRESAVAYESKIKKTADELAMQKSVKALVENFREELSCGEKIILSDAFSLYMKKPKQKKASEKQMKSKESRFEDFVLYMKSKHPDIKHLRGVTPSHADEYISYIRSNGRFSKIIRSKKCEYHSNITALSPATLNRHLEELKSVFDSLLKQAGLIENPFSGILPTIEDSETREAFSEKELESILSSATPFIRAIFVVGFFTALREGDIATLRWADVLWEHGVIRRKLMKTGNVVEIPIMPPLAEFLRSQIGKSDEYVLPAHAEMYQKNPSGISYRVKKFLEEELHIKTTKKVSGRTRSISIKDVHSLRHTFCYFAGVAGIPLVVVQSIVGHMTPEMTAHYTAHADRATKREKLAMLPNLIAFVVETRRTNLIEQKRSQLIRFVENADDDTLSRIATMFLPTKAKRLSLRSIGQDTPK